MLLLCRVLACALCPRPRRSGVAAGAGLQPDAADRREAVSDDLPGAPHRLTRRSALALCVAPARPSAPQQRQRAPCRETPARRLCCAAAERSQRLGRLRVPQGPLRCRERRPTLALCPCALRAAQEVETLFHEFGHALQHMLTEQADGLVAGIRGIEWDAVELPSQFMEGWRAPTRNPTAILQSRSVSAARLGVPG